MCRRASVSPSVGFLSEILSEILTEKVGGQPGPNEEEATSAVAACDWPVKRIVPLLKGHAL